MHSLSFDVRLEGEETVLAGLGLKNRCRSPEYEPGILFTFSCKIQADVLAFSSMLNAHSIDLSSHVGAFGCRRF